MNQHFNGTSRLPFNRTLTCGIGVEMAPATAARTVEFNNRERTSRGLHTSQETKAAIVIACRPLC
jgi:hypothetical protein